MSPRLGSLMIASLPPQPWISSGRGASARRAAGDLVGPQFAADADRGGALVATAFGCSAVPVPKCGRPQPRFKGGFVPPPGHYQPGGALVSGLEELKTLEAVLVVDGTCPGGEPAGKLVPAVRRHRDRVDLHNGHVLDHASVPSPGRSPGRWAGDHAGRPP